MKIFNDFKNFYNNQNSEKWNFAENYVPEIIILLRPTSPLRKIKILKKALNILFKKRIVESVRSISLMDKSIYKMWCLKNNFLKPVIKNDTIFVEPYNAPRQKLKKFFDQKFKEDVDNLASAVQAKNIKFPVLVVHDSQDGDVAVSCAQNIRQNLEKGSLLLTNGLGHTKILRDKYTMNRAVNFIKNNS